jgi:hypothetical protein
VKHWETVEQEMDQVANKHRASVRAGSGGGGAGGKAAGRAGAAGSKPAGAAPKAGSTTLRGTGVDVKGTAGQVKGAGAEVKGAVTEAKVAGIEAKAIKAEVAGAEMAAGVAKASKAARLGGLLMALALPGPQDVFFLFISAFASIAEAKAKLRADAYATGFAKGLAAAVTWISAADAKEMLMYREINPSMGERVAGFEGVRERGSNEGVAAGWKFGSEFNADQRKGFRRHALEIAGLPERRRYSRNNYIDMGIALRPTVVELLAEAERQEREKEARAVLAAQQAAGGPRPPM